MPVDSGVAAAGEDWSIALGVAADTGVEADTGAVAVGAGGGAVDGPAAGGTFAVDALRFGTGFGLDFGLGDFGVEGELTWVGVGALATGVEAAAGEAAFSAPCCFFFVVAAERTGVG